jgi:hypothetical protein
MVLPCQAQQPGGVPGIPVLGTPAQQPLSPYLNLLRPNTSPVLNYYGLVRPQTQTQSSLQSLQGQINPLMNNSYGYDQPLPTGVSFGFQNHRSYFQNQFAVGGLGAGISPGRSGVGTGMGGGGLGSGVGSRPAQGVGAAPSGTGLPGQGIGGLGGLPR